MIELRAHHLLCSILYEGKGYNDEFVENMNKVVSQLKRGGMVKIIKKPDSICVECPNAKSDGGCALEKDSKEIKDLDQFILDSFGIKENEEADSFHFYSQIAENITEEIFNKSCGECRWKKAGLCSYNKYIEELKSVI